MVSSLAIPKVTLILSCLSLFLLNVLVTGVHESNFLPRCPFDKPKTQPLATTTTTTTAIDDGIDINDNCTVSWDCQHEGPCATSCNARRFCRGLPSASAEVWRTTLVEPSTCLHNVRYSVDTSPFGAYSTQVEEWDVQIHRPVPGVYCMRSTLDDHDESKNCMFSDEGYMDWMPTSWCAPGPARCVYQSYSFYGEIDACTLDHYCQHYQRQNQGFYNVECRGDLSGNHEIVLTNSTVCYAAGQGWLDMEDRTGCYSFSRTLVYNRGNFLNTADIYNFYQGLNLQYSIEAQNCPGNHNNNGTCPCDVWFDGVKCNSCSTTPSCEHLTNAGANSLEFDCTNIAAGLKFGCGPGESYGEFFLRVQDALPGP